MGEVFADVQLAQVVSTIVYSVVGILIYALAFVLLEIATPFSVKHEIIEEHNTALGIILGAISIGIALILSAAIH